MISAPLAPAALALPCPAGLPSPFDLAPPPFGAFLPSAGPPNRSLTSSDCFAASAAAFFWRPQRLSWLPQLSQRRPLSSLPRRRPSSRLPLRLFLSFSGRFLLRGLCGFCSAAAAAAFFASSACFLAAAAAAASFLASASAFFCASACALATFSASAFALAAAASATFCCSLALAAAASAAFAARRPVSAAPLPSAVAQPAPWRPAQLSPAPPNALSPALSGAVAAPPASAEALRPVAPPFLALLLGTLRIVALLLLAVVLFHHRAGSTITAPTTVPSPPPPAPMSTFSCSDPQISRAINMKCRTTETITARFSLSFCSVAFTKIDSQNWCCLYGVPGPQRRNRVAVRLTVRSAGSSAPRKPRPPDGEYSMP